MKINKLTSPGVSVTGGETRANTKPDKNCKNEATFRVCERTFKLQNTFHSFQLAVATAVATNLHSEGKLTKHQSSPCEVSKFPASIKGAFHTSNMTSHVILLTNQQIALLSAPLWRRPAETRPSEPPRALLTSFALIS